MHEITGQHLIAGQWRSLVGATFKATAPQTGALLEPGFAESGAGEVDAALEAAREAFEKTLDLPPRWPADLLDRIADRIMDLGDALLARAESETALPRGRLTMERGRACGQLKMFAQIARDASWVDAVIECADPKRAPLPKPDLRRMLRPRGPVVVFGASNFPLAFGAVGGDTASALAAGNPVVVKGHPSHPGTTELLASAVLSALQALSLPPGTFAALQGKTHELSNTLVKHPLTTAVGFTGSQQVGRALFDIAARRPSPIPVYAEMGSLNPIVIFSEALVEGPDAIAKGLATSLMLGSGQFCTKPGVILIVGGDDEMAGSFVDSLAKHVAASGTLTMLNPGLRDNFTKRISNFSTLPGVKMVLAGNPSSAAMTQPVLLETTAQVFCQQRALQEEAFGPGALLVRCRDAEDAIRCLDTVAGSLTGTIHRGVLDDDAEVRRIARKLESIAGRVVVNGYPTGVEVNSAIVHGGPYPATTDPGTTSVGSAAIRRFARLIAYQDAPDNLLPPALQDSNPLHIERVVDGRRTRDGVHRNANHH